MQVTASGVPTLKVMISGAPAAGKGTQCAKIVEKVRARGTSGPCSSCARWAVQAPECHPGVY